MAKRPKELPDLHQRLDQAILDPLLTNGQLLEMCDEGRQEGVRGICTTLPQLSLIRDRLGRSDSGPRLIAAISFPFGSLPSELKLAEAEWAAAHGAQELDVAPDFNALANNEANRFSEEIATLCDLGLPVRVVLDMARLTEEQLGLAVEASIDAGASGLQTGNGFGPPCHPAQIEQLNELCRSRCSIKAAGGIHSLELAREIMEAGADLIGTTSAPQLMQALRRPGG